MNNQVKIRNAIHQDVDKLVKFNSQMALETENLQLDNSTLNRGVNAVINDPDRGFYLIAEIDGKVSGSLMITTEWSDWRNADYWWIQSVYVAPPFRRQGIFRALYAEAKKRAAQNNTVCGCRLYVERNNTPAQKTYKNLGFVETHYKVFEEMFPK